MNYRHAYHAGNFADVMKHATLARILEHLRQKPAPFRVVDTHAGIGRYDLSADEAGRTGEAEGGVGRLAEPFADEVEAMLAPYRAALAVTRARWGETTYPGSPAIIREGLRPHDRAILIEKHPEDGATLRERFNAGQTTKVLLGDGWAMLGGLIPPKERRGLVLIDPPYEERDEMARAGHRVAAAVARWPTGIYALWYPIKDTRDADDLAAALAVPRPVLRLEVLVDDPQDRTRLNGSGLIVVNPPWTLAEEAARLLPALAERLARGRYGSFRCDLSE